MGVLRTAIIAVAISLAVASCATERDHSHHVATHGQVPDHELPYIVNVNAGAGEIRLFGTDHFFTPQHRLAKEIAESWSEFSPTIAYNEGGNPPVANSIADAIRSFGEPGLLRYLAARDGVPIASLEPRQRDEADALSQTLGAEKAKIFMTLRALQTLKQSGKPLEIDSFLNDLLGSGWPWDAGQRTEPLNAKRFQELCRDLLPGFRSLSDVTPEWLDPTVSGRYTNEAARISVSFRDRHMYRKITEQAERGNRVFVLVGASHVAALEPALMSRYGPSFVKRSHQP